MTSVLCAAAFFSGTGAVARADSVAPEFVIAAARMTAGPGNSELQPRVDTPSKELSAANPFNQAAVKQGGDVARLGPDPGVPYFTVRFALPIPPDNETNLSGARAGLDPMVLAHNHSPGFEILPNGDVLAIYFSAKDSRGASESDASARFIQARLRFGADQWDPPELFFDSKGFNDQSGLLWADGNTIRFFGGGRENPVPFKMATSSDNGATWTFSLPLLDKPAADFTPQPIVNAFRGASGIYFAMDAGKDQSFLWRSLDGGVHWHDMGGRTGGRHSTIIPLDEKGTLLSIGGKNTGINGYSPQNISTDWGATWSTNEPSPFPALGGNQRPCLIRLANGHLCFVSDSYHRKKENSPEGWKYGEGTFVAISKDQGATWHFKRLPVELPHEADKKHGTLGYATVRQGPNGVLHVLSTMTQPCLHYEFNEAWVFSDAGDVGAESSGGKIEKYSETYPDGKARATWSARICPHGRYLLEGVETSYYTDGHKEHEATYASGRKIGVETFWAPDGTKLWSWMHRPANNVSIWTQYWSNGQKRVESRWNTMPRARDLARSFTGFEANGPVSQWNQDGSPAHTYSFVNGAFIGEVMPATKESRAP